MDSDATHDDSTQRILNERARALAQAQVQADEIQGEELVVFRLGDTAYGVPARHVKGVHPITQYTPLAGTPAFILGLVNVRSRLLTAVDIRPLLNLPTIAPQPDALLLIVTAKHTEIALLTDTVLGVRQLAGTIAPTPSSMAGHGVAWLQGVDQHFTLLIDATLLLADPRLMVNTRA